MSGQMTATEIIPKLFLGTREDAASLGLRVPSDWACISVTEYRKRYNRKEELPNEPEGSLDLPFMVDSPNGWYADPYKLDLIAEVIWWNLLHGKKVLVHCVHAQERSPLAVVWYLAWSGEEPSFERAYATVERLHPRTERRDRWVRGIPGGPRAELKALLEEARAMTVRRPLGVLEEAAARWAVSAGKTLAMEPRRREPSLHAVEEATGVFVVRCVCGWHRRFRDRLEADREAMAHRRETGGCVPGDDR